MTGWPKPVQIPGTPCGARLKRPREDGRTRCVKLVVGGGPCRSHGGAAPQIKASRERRLVQQRAEAEAKARNPQAPTPSPRDAMLEELGRTYRRIGGLELRLDTFDELAGQPGQQLVTTDERQALNDRLTAERGHYARLAAECVRLNVTPDAPGVAHEYAQELARFVEVLLQRMGFDAYDPELVAVVRSTLADLDAGRLGQGFEPEPVVPSFADPSQLPGRVIEGSTE